MKTCSMTIETKKSLTEEVFLSLLNKWSGKCLSVIRDEKRKMIAVRCEKGMCMEKSDVGNTF